MTALIGVLLLAGWAYWALRHLTVSAAAGPAAGFRSGPAAPPGGDPLTKPGPTHKEGRR
jgi:hypothetical protein